VLAGSLSSSKSLARVLGTTGVPPGGAGQQAGIREASRMLTPQTAAKDDASEIRESIMPPVE
jgi:hypothetical protein